jgi:hypothetical protein
VTAAIALGGPAIGAATRSPGPARGSLAAIGPHPLARLGPVGGPAAQADAAAAGCSAAAGTHIAFVIDLGPDVERACVTVPSGDNDAEALATVSSALHWSAPRYADSGLLCAIDDVPKSGCGTPTSNGYAYWSYWDGSPARWTYGDGDPSTTTVSPATTVGWRFQPDGRGNPTDPPPRGPSDPAEVCTSGGAATIGALSAGTTAARGPLTCSSLIPTSSTSPPPTTVPTTATTGATGPRPSGPAPTTVPAPAPVAPVRSGGTTTTVPNGPADPPGYHPPKGRRRHRTTTTTAPSGGGTRAASTSTATSPPTTTRAARLAAGATSRPASGKGSLSYLLFGAFLVLLGGGVFYSRWRRSRPPEP